MQAWAQRLIGYGFLAAFCIVGPLFLLIAIGAAVDRAVFIHAALRVDGTIIELRPTGTTRTGAGAVVPVVRFTADDGRTYISVADVNVLPSTFSRHERVTVLYLPGHPETARIDALSPLWQVSLVLGAVGAGFSVIPAVLLANVLRQRRALRGTGG